MKFEPPICPECGKFPVSFSAECSATRPGVGGLTPPDTNGDQLATGLEFTDCAPRIVGYSEVVTLFCECGVEWEAGW